MFGGSFNNHYFSALTWNQDEMLTKTYILNSQLILYILSL